MARLTLEALEDRYLMSANPLGQTLAAPPPPPALMQYDFTDVMVESLSASHQQGQLVMNFSLGASNPGR
jgi:hypothetical protein